MTREALAPLRLAGLWLAFAGVCLALLVTGGHGPLLIAKLRLGGLTAVTTTSCEPTNTCYFCPNCGDTDTDADPPTCDNSRDDDHDGWTDAEDPDCLEGQHELGYGTTACNDGLDNDGDLWVDHADRDGDDTWDETE